MVVATLPNTGSLPYQFVHSSFSHHYSQISIAQTMLHSQNQPMSTTANTVSILNEDATSPQLARLVASVSSPLPRHKELGLSYEALLREDEEGGFVATIPILRGCVTQGDDVEEVLSHLQNALRGWLKVAQKRGLDIPPPDAVQTP